MLLTEFVQEGETAVHYAAELTASQVHYDGEDVQLIRLLLDYGGDINIRTKLVCMLVYFMNVRINSGFHRGFVLLAGLVFPLWQRRQSGLKSGAS